MELTDRGFPPLAGIEAIATLMRPSVMRMWRCSSALSPEAPDSSK